MTRRASLGRTQDGYTLVEVLVAATILVVGVLGTLSLLDGANRATAKTKAREGAISLAREAIESARAVPYPRLTPSSIDDELQAQTGLEDATPGGAWQIVRRNTTFTVSATVCSVDDNTITKDGLGDHSGGSYCADSTAQGTVDTNPDDYKRVAIDVKWNDGSDRTVRQEAVINNPGSAFAPAIKSLTPNPNTTPITTAVASIGFTAVTSSRPVSVKWSVDNVQRGSATGSDTTWTFGWDVSAVDDGTYLVSALAYDQFGESGTGRTRTIVLNRFAPRTPTGFVAGRNGTFGAEFEWNPNTEPDVSGYRVYRVVGANPGGSDVKVCETATTDRNPTTCADPLAPPAPATVRYYVVALGPARSGGSPLEESARPGAAGTSVLSNTNVVPNPPNGLTLTEPGDGSVVLTWTDPDAPAAGEAGDSVRYYRIYRDGVAYANRYDRTGAANETTFTDTSAGTGPHTYWVTTVDSELAESAPVRVDRP